MDKDEFIQKLTEIKEKIEVIFKEVRSHNAYIYHQKDYEEFKYQVEGHLTDITYNIDYYSRVNTSEEFRIKKVNEFTRYLKLDINMWNDLSKYDFDPDHGGFRLKKRDDKDTLHYL